MRPRRIIIRNTPTIQKEDVKQTPLFKYKIITSSSYVAVDEDVILVKKTKSCQITLPLNFTEGKKINIQDWVPSRDGFLVEISNSNNKNIESNIILNNYNLASKLFLNYEDNQEKEQILKQYFS